jgi:glutaredoxin
MFHRNLRVGLLAFCGLIPAVFITGTAAADGIQIIRGEGVAHPASHRAAQGSPQADREPSGKEVVMYGASWCGYCSKARSYFEQHHIPFTEYDVEKSAKGARDYRAFGSGGLPLILVGDSGMHGFSASSFAALYYGN